MFCRMRNSMHRRRFIQGVGGSLLALPLLEAHSIPGKVSPPKRLTATGIFYGFVPENFHPEETGKNYASLSPSQTPRSFPQGLHGFFGARSQPQWRTQRDQVFSVRYSHERIQGLCRGQRIDRPESRPIRRRPDTLPLAGFGLGQGQRTYLVLDPKRKCHSSDTQFGEALSNALPQGRWPLSAIKSNGIWRTSVPFWI